MKKMCQVGSVVVLAGVFVVALTMLQGPRQAAQAGAEEAGRSAAAPHYTVVETQGHNLLVTDNVTNKLYFYTADKDKPVGSPLKLRGSVDLNKVGQPEIAVTAHAVEK